jgi:hypothetical protein
MGREVETLAFDVGYKSILFTVYNKINIQLQENLIQECGEPMG